MIGHLAAVSNNYFSLRSSRYMLKLNKYLKIVNKMHFWIFRLKQVLFSIFSFIKCSDRHYSYYCTLQIIAFDSAIFLLFIHEIIENETDIIHLCTRLFLFSTCMKYRSTK